MARARECNAGKMGEEGEVAGPRWSAPEQALLEAKNSADICERSRRVRPSERAGVRRLHVPAEVRGWLVDRLPSLADGLSSARATGTLHAESRATVRRLRQWVIGPAEGDQARFRDIPHWAGNIEDPLVIESKAGVDLGMG
jgi:hypothetical protein